MLIYDNSSLFHECGQLQTFHKNETQQKLRCTASEFFLEVPPRFELGNEGFADLCLTAWPRHRILQKERYAFPIAFGAGDEARTRYLHLGKVALYRMSYTRIYGASGRS